MNEPKTVTVEVTAIEAVYISMAIRSAAEKISDPGLSGTLAAIADQFAKPKAGAV